MKNIIDYKLIKNAKLDFEERHVPAKLTDRIQKLISGHSRGNVATLPLYIVSTNAESAKFEVCAWKACNW